MELRDKKGARLLEHSFLLRSRQQWSRILPRANFLPNCQVCPSFPHLSPCPRITFDLAPWAQGLSPSLQKRPRSPPQCLPWATVNSPAGETTHAERRGARHGSQGKERAELEPHSKPHRPERLPSCRAELAFAMHRAASGAAEQRGERESPPLSRFECQAGQGGRLSQSQG